MTWLKTKLKKHESVQITLFIIAILVGPAWLVWWLGGDVSHWLLIMWLIFAYLEISELKSKNKELERERFLNEFKISSDSK